MRRRLGLDRPDDPLLTPMPALDELPAMVERVRAAGLDVTLRVDGDVAAVPAGVGLSAYRIVQESLTNVLKHAGANTRVEVDVHTTVEVVELTVRDHGAGVHGVPGERYGNGVRGMRERVAMLGGLFTAGNAPGGGYVVHAALPLGEPLAAVT